MTGRAGISLTAEGDLGIKDWLASEVEDRESK